MLKLELAEDGRACGGRTKVKRKRGIIEERGREGEGGKEREGVSPVGTKADGQLSTRVSVLSAVLTDSFQYHHSH